MKLWVISKGHVSEDGRGDYSTRECVVLQPFAVSAPYTYEAFTVISTREQKDALAAREEVSKLSQAARDKLGITFHHVAALQNQAEPPLQLGAGDTVYVGVYAGIDGRGRPQVTGVSTWDRSDEGYVTCYPMKIYPDLETYLQEKNPAALNKEVAGVSPATKRLLGLKP